MKRLTRTASLVLLSGSMTTACISIPQQLQGEFAPLEPQDIGESHLQMAVRWGGVVLETRPESDHTCFEILSRQLQKSLRPRQTDQSGGRFIACKAGFHDPEVFKKGREVTLTGKVILIDHGKVGDFDYPFPVVDIEFMSLWPKRRPPHYRYYGPLTPWYWHYPHLGFHYPYPY